MASENNPYEEVGGLMASLLASPQCPSSVREAIVAHLNSLYQKSDLTRPDMVRLLYHLLAPEAAPTATGNNDQHDEPVLAEVAETGSAPELNGTAPSSSSEGEILEAVS
ncbi:MAG: hypothetical protein U0Z53_01575 [Blastocatellia bacterium]